MAAEINFVSGGFLGDFIHSLYVVKNICELTGEKANLYISNHGEVWTRGIETAYRDLLRLVESQWYVNKFQIYNPDKNPEGAINLSDWRKTVATTHSETGKYDKCWSKLLSEVYKFPIPTEYKWLEVPTLDLHTKGCAVIHRSKHRHNPNFKWQELLDKITDMPIYFVTTDAREWELFPYKKGVQLYLVDNILQLAAAINLCKVFVGNQSAPLAIASALDVPRLIELDFDPAPFYMDEEKYSNNVSWYLSDECKFLRK